METNTLLQYLQIFALSALGFLILSLLILSVYALFLVKLIKVGVTEIIKDTHKVVTFFDDESRLVVNTVKSKVESINIEKVLFGSSIIGGIISGFQNAKKSQRKTKK